ncbi:MAG: DUF411 domain-containing protein [Halopseudomonas sp.]|uniref:DUF411 domain-containing protein n=1 Tax=Halopseudomonas sp. TaxID=2901191 RepID=UPI0030028BF9
MRVIFPRWVLFTLGALPLLAACNDPVPEKPQTLGGAEPTQNQSLLAEPATGNLLQVFKSPTCGCCEGWIEHADQAGFSTQAQHPADMAALKTEHGIAPQYRSCHTAVSADGYVFEGHVPARYIEAFLAAPPAGALGLAVPGMPVGSPGMEMGKDFMPYQVLLLKQGGAAEVYAQVESPADQ